jgi:ferredoxin
MTGFIALLPRQSNMPCFVFNTYAGVLANTPLVLFEHLKPRGFVVVAHEHFQGEVSWPVARAFGVIINRGRPDERSLPRITQFASKVAKIARDSREGMSPQQATISFNRLNPFYYMGRRNSPGALRGLMGAKGVDRQKCTQCGRCRDCCAVRAISLDPYPSFNEKCTGCWGCYNICPEGAISTSVGTRGRYTARAYLLENRGVSGNMEEPISR